MATKTFPAEPLCIDVFMDREVWNPNNQIQSEGKLIAL